MNPLSKKTTIQSIGVGTFVFGLFALGFLFGNGLATNSYAAENNSDSLLLNKVRGALDSKFIFWKSSSTLPTEKELEYGMIQGYVSSYKDPYTVFFPPKEAKSFAENVSGSFGGVGMTVGMKDGNITVIAPLKDSPAMKAGIRSGDIITAVDGKSILGLSSETEAVMMIRGQIDTKVIITVIHKDAKNTVDITIVRKEIKIPTLDTEKLNGAFIIHLYNFSAESPDLFRKAINDFIASNIKYLVVDLRGNPGGYLESAVNMTSYFLQQGQIVVTEKQGRDEVIVDHRSSGNIKIPNGTKIVVLVDGGSASASEIFAGALKDQGIAKIVGEKTFGKGSVQELINFEGGSSLKVTVAKWYTPNGINISEGGINPDVISVATTTVKGKDGKLLDVQLLKAIEVVETMK